MQAMMLGALQTYYAIPPTVNHRLPRSVVIEAANRRFLHAVKMKDDLKLAFELFDKDGDAAISSDELGSVLRSCGKYPTEDQIQEMGAHASPMQPPLYVTADEKLINSLALTLCCPV